MRNDLVVALVMACLAGPVAAQTAAEDEARIEELIAAEQRALAVAADKPTSKREGVADPVEESEAGEDAGPTVVDGVAITRATDDSNVVEFADLDEHVGGYVRILSVGGRTRVGRVESVDAAGVAMTVRTGGGYATFKLPVAQIRRIERVGAGP